MVRQPSTSPDHGGFFTHHGVWAPGVRLFRQVGFGMKSTMISAAFAIPLAVLAWSYFGANQASIAFSSTERVGVAYVRALLPEMAAAQDARAASKRGDLPARAAPTALDAVQRDTGTELGTGKAWAAVAAARDAIAALPADAFSDSRSTRRSRPRGPASPAAASPWSPPRCGRSRIAAPTPPGRSRP